jgi:hypothetical protein
MNETSAPGDPNSTFSDPAEFRRQCLAMCVVSALVALASRWPAALFLIAAGGTVFADAWTVGVGRGTKGPGLKKISPLVWGVLAGLSPVVGLPIYLFNRNHLKSRAGNKVAWVLIICIGLVGLLLLPFMPMSLLVGPFD